MTRRVLLALGGVALLMLMPYRGTAHAATTNHLTGGDWSIVTSTKWPYPCVKWEAGSPDHGGDLGCPNMTGYRVHAGGRITSHGFAPRWTVAEISAGLQEARRGARRGVQPRPDRRRAPPHVRALRPLGLAQPWGYVVRSVLTSLAEPHRVAMLAFFAWVAYEHNRRDA